MVLDKDLYIIAEVANAAQGMAEVNHQIINAVSKTGADAIKFQFYKYDELATLHYEKYENLRRTFYSTEERISFVRHARDVGLDVVIDIFDRWGLSVVRKVIGQISGVKIPPAVIMDEELVGNILDLEKLVLVGVGGYEDQDIDLLLSKMGPRRDQIVLMHGFQGFPTDEKDSSLARIGHLKAKYGLPVGYADHIDAESDLALRLPEYALFAGATVIEKHITLDRDSKGLDYYSSLLPNEFKRMVHNLKRCVTINASKAVCSAEKDYLKHATRVTTVRSVKAGEVIFRRDVKFRRTNKLDAMFPNQWGEFNPTVAVRDLGPDDGVSQDDVRKGVIGTIVGCRMHSKRLPRKALLEINGIPSIERCLLNATASELSQKTILATSTHDDDAVLGNYTLNGKVDFFRGAETDLVARFLGAADKYGLDIIVRVTGDRPLISYELIDYLIKAHLKAGVDFSFFKNTPQGVNPEVFNTAALKHLKSLIPTEEYSEYLTLFFKNNPEHFRLNEVEPPEEFRHPEYRLCLDYPEDLEMFKKLFERLDVHEGSVSLRDVLRILNQQPEISRINSDIKPVYIDGEFAEFLNRVTVIKNES